MWASPWVVLLRFSAGTLAAVGKASRPVSVRVGYLDQARKQVCPNCTYLYILDVPEQSRPGSREPWGGHTRDFLLYCRIRPSIFHTKYLQVKECSIEYVSTPYSVYTDRFP